MGREKELLMNQLEKIHSILHSIYMYKYICIYIYTIFINKEMGFFLPDLYNLIFLKGNLLYLISYISYLFYLFFSICLFLLMSYICKLRKNPFFFFLFSSQWELFWCRAYAKLSSVTPPARWTVLLNVVRFHFQVLKPIAHKHLGVKVMVEG